MRYIVSRLFDVQSHTTALISNNFAFVLGFTQPNPNLKIMMKALSLGLKSSSHCIVSDTVWVVHPVLRASSKHSLMFPQVIARRRFHPTCIINDHPHQTQPNLA
jgi:hypothetical protein